MLRSAATLTTLRNLSALRSNNWTLLPVKALSIKTQLLVKKHALQKKLCNGKSCPSMTGSFFRYNGSMKNSSNTRSRLTDVVFSLRSTAARRSSTWSSRCSGGIERLVMTSLTL